MIDKTLPLSLGYMEQRKGNAIYIERQEDIPADLSPYQVIKFKRGMTFNFDLKGMSGKDFLSFGDADAPKPVIIRPNTTNEGVKVTDCLIADLYIRGGIRGLSFYQGGNIRLQRLWFSGNIDTSNSQSIYAKYVKGITVSQCGSMETFGDFFYGVGCEGAELAYNDIWSVNGGAADGIQFSHEGKADRRNSYVTIRDNIIRTDSDSTSGKGAIAIEGTDGYSVYNNDVEGQFFGIALSGTKGQVFENTVHCTNPDINWGFGIGVSNSFDADTISVTGNTVRNSPRGIVVSAPNPAAPPARLNLNIKNNKVENCPITLKVDVPYTGYVEGA